MRTSTNARKWIRSAALAALIVAPRHAHAAPAEQKQFDLFPNPAAFRCLAAFPDDPTKPPSATVTVKQGKLNDTLTIKLKNIKEGLGFDLFTVEHSPLDASGAPAEGFQNFGLAWYQSDLEVGKNHKGTTTIKTILINQIFGFDPAVGLAPTNTFHVGFWFDSPDAVADCNIHGSTPFNGDHHAGPFAMISVPDNKTDLGPLCLDPDLSSDPVVCNP